MEKKEKQINEDNKNWEEKNEIKKKAWEENFEKNNSEFIKSLNQNSPIEPIINNDDSFPGDNSDYSNEYKIYEENLKRAKNKNKKKFEEMENNHKIEMDKLKKIQKNTDYIYNKEMKRIKNNTENELKLEEEKKLENEKKIKLK